MFVCQFDFSFIFYLLLLLLFLFVCLFVCCCLSLMYFMYGKNIVLIVFQLLNGTYINKTINSKKIKCLFLYLSPVLRLRNCFFCIMLSQ